MKIRDLAAGYAEMNAGTWVDDIPLPYFQGIRLKVRWLGNPDYVAMAAALNAARPRDKKGTVVNDPNEAERIVDECLKKTVLLDWYGLDEPFSAAA